MQLTTVMWNLPRSADGTIKANLMYQADYVSSVYSWNYGSLMGASMAYTLTAAIYYRERKCDIYTWATDPCDDDTQDFIEVAGILTVRVFRSLWFTMGAGFQLTRTESLVSEREIRTFGFTVLGYGAKVGRLDGLALAGRSVTSSDAQQVATWSDMQI